MDSGETPHLNLSHSACTLAPSSQPLASEPLSPPPRAPAPGQAAPRLGPRAQARSASYLVRSEPGGGASTPEPARRWPRSGCTASAGCPDGLYGRGEGRLRGQGRPLALAPWAAGRAGRQRGPLSAAGGARAAGPGGGRGGRRRPAPPAGRVQVGVLGALCPASFPPPFGARRPRGACWAAYPRRTRAGRRGAPAEEMGRRP